MRKPKKPTAAHIVAFAVLYFVAVKISLWFAVTPDVLVMLWIPNGLLLAFLIHHHFQRFALFAVAIAVAEVAADFASFSLLEALLYAGVNLLEATVAFWILRKWKFSPRFAAPQDLGKFFVAGPIVGASLGALIAGAVHSVFQGGDSSYIAFVRTWWFSDATGLMLITPLVLNFWPTHSNVYREKFLPTPADAVAGVLAVAVTTLLLLSNDGTLGALEVRPVWLFPFALYAAVRFGPRATKLIVLTFAGIILYVTSAGLQPFGPMPITDTILQAQQVILIMSGMAISLAGLLAQLRSNARLLERRVQERTLDLRRANERLRRIATIDSLTGVLNRRALFEVLASEIDRHRRHNHPLAVILFDLDHFKDVNDRFGHAVGDSVLRHIAQLAAGLIRANDSLGRYGGEEFVLIAPETDLEQALHLSERMRDAFRISESVDPRYPIAITASFGVAILQAADLKPEELLSRADRALYAAKAAGRNRVIVDRSHDAATVTA